VGVIVYNNSTGEKIHQRLSRLLSGSRVDIYRNDHKNEETTNVLEDGVTVLNKESVKGQEFDAIFVLELERFIPCAYHTEKRAMYMMCSRARDHLFLVYGPGDLSKPAAEALPGPDMLERS
jgi:superfamily I DNA/RNA helicase